jgi:uncharacterized membrane protein YfcA
MYLLPLRLDRTVFVGTTVAFFAAVNFAKLPSYLALGLFDREVLATVLVLAPIAAGGMLLGVWLHGRVSDRLFYAACYLFVLLTGLKLVHDGLRAFL